MKSTFFLILIVALVASCCKKAEPVPLSPIYESCCNTAPRYFPSDVYVPNAFTPHNKDGVNDFFFPKVRDLRFGRIIRFEVWASNGNLLWQKIITEDNYRDTLGYAWDGTYEDANAPLPVGPSNRTQYKGLFNYRVGFGSGTSITNSHNGEACCIACESGAEGLLDREGCYFPNQEASPGTYDPTPLKVRDVESIDCFIY